MEHKRKNEYLETFKEKDTNFPIRIRVAEKCYYERASIIFYNGLRNAICEYRQALLQLKAAREYTYEKMLALYHLYLTPFFKTFHQFCIAQEIYDISITQKSLEKWIDVEIIKEASSLIKELNEWAKSNIAPFQWTNTFSNGDGLEAEDRVLMEPLILEMETQIKQEDTKRKYSSLVKKQIFEGINEIITEMSKEMFKRGLVGYRTLAAGYECHTLDIIDLMKKKEEVLGVLENLKVLTTQNKSEMAKQYILKFLEEAPYFEELYMMFIEIFEVTDIEQQYAVVELAKQYIDPLYEKNKELTSLEEKLSKSLFLRDLKRLRNAEQEEIEDTVCELVKKYPIKDATFIFENQLNLLGKLYWKSIQLEEVAYETRKNYFASVLQNMKLNEDSERTKVTVETLKNKLFTQREKEDRMTGPDIIYRLELKYLGQIVCDLPIENWSYQQCKTLVYDELKFIKELNIENEQLCLEKVNDVKKKEWIEVTDFYAIEKNIFGKYISITEDDLKERTLIDQMLESYKKVEKERLNVSLELIYDRDQYFKSESFMNKQMHAHQELRDQFLIACNEKSRNPNPEEGFVISDKAIYSYQWSKPIMIKEITKIILAKVAGSNYREFKQEIQIKVEGQPYQTLYTSFADHKELLFDFLKEILSYANPYIEFIDLLRDDKKIIDTPLNYIHQKTAEEMIQIVIKNVNAVIERYGEQLHYPNKMIKSNKKINRALKAYCQIEEGETPILCYDDTVFGGAKDGFLITNKRIYSSGVLRQKWNMNLYDVTKVIVNDSNVFFNEKAASISIVDKKERDAFQEFMTSLINQLIS